jgi:hypothetical protein
MTTHEYSYAVELAAVLAWLAAIVLGVLALSGSLPR